jgi:hypothetical protein
MPLTRCPLCGEIDRVLRVQLALDNHPGSIAQHFCLFCLKLKGNTGVSVSVTQPLHVVFPQKDRVKRATAREKKAATEIGGQRVSQSGAGIVKGDARNDTWLIEDKFTDAASYSVRKSLVEKVVAQAAQTMRKPAIRVGISGLSNVVVLLWSDFLELIEGKK